MENAEMSEVFVLCMRIGAMCKAGPLTKHEACWEHAVTDDWLVVLNGHPEPKPCSLGKTVPPRSVLIGYRGQAVGVARATECAMLVPGVDPPIDELERLRVLAEAMKDCDCICHREKGPVVHGSPCCAAGGHVRAEVAAARMLQGEATFVRVLKLHIETLAEEAKSPLLR